MSESKLSPEELQFEKEINLFGKDPETLDNPKDYIDIQIINLQDSLYEKFEAIKEAFSILGVNLDDLMMAKARREDLEFKQQQLDKRLADGELVQVAAITERSLIVGMSSTETIGRWELEYSKINPEVQPLLLGKSVGFVINGDMTMGDTFTITAIYDKVEPVKETWTEADIGKTVDCNGHKYQITRNEHGSIYKKEMVRRVIPANAIPMPGTSVLANVMEALAKDQLGISEENLFNKISQEYTKEK